MTTTWILEVVFDFDTEDEAKEMMNSITVLSPDGLSAMHIRKEDYND